MSKCAQKPTAFCEPWANYILSKGRTSSHLLQPLVRKLAAVQLALNALELHGHVESAENPTDAASRA